MRREGPGPPLTPWPSPCSSFPEVKPGPKGPVSSSERGPPGSGQARFCFSVLLQAIYFTEIRKGPLFHTHSYAWHKGTLEGPRLHLLMALPGCLQAPGQFLLGTGVSGVGDGSGWQAWAPGLFPPSGRPFPTAPGPPACWNRPFPGFPGALPPSSARTWRGMVPQGAHSCLPSSPAVNPNSRCL